MKNSKNWGTLATAFLVICGLNTAALSIKAIQKSCIADIPKKEKPRQQTVKGIKAATLPARKKQKASKAQ